MDTTINIKKTDGYPKVEPRLKGIPEALKAQPWAVWIAEPRPNQTGKFNKAPRSPVTGIKIGANDPTKFGTFAQAVTALESGRFSGLGVLLTDSGLVGWDVDDYRETFQQRSEVKALVAKARKARAYCEESPSGNGLRLFMRGKLPAGGRKAGPLEIYDNARFLTVTGKRPTTDASAPDFIDGQALIDEFLALMGPEKAPAAPTTPAPVAQGMAHADPAQVEELVRQMEEQQALLWAGQWQDRPGLNGATMTGYPSQSEADMALIGGIARAAVRLGVDDAALSDTVREAFLRGGLYRPEKLDRVETRDIPKAISDALAQRQARAVAQPLGEASSVSDEGPPGDVRAGRAFAKAMRGKRVYVAPAGRWMGWTGGVWEGCTRGEEMAAAKRVADKVLTHTSALYAADPDRYRKAMQWAMGLQNINRLLAMVELAKSEEGMTVGHMAELDANPMLLGVRNGVLDLKTSTLLAPDPKMLITRQAAAEYHRGAACPRWQAFMESIFPGDPDTVKFIQRALGYTLTASTTEEVMFICLGSGANGKSVFANVVSTSMGDYSQMAPPSLLTVRQAGDAGPRNDIARLAGARFLSVNELQQGDRLDEQVVKMLAGREMLSARFLHKEFFDFWPTAKAWVRTNHRPIVTGEDDGIWRRLYLIAFRQKFAEHERDPFLESKLLEERDGILAWMVEGCLDWQRVGLKPSETVRRESSSYRKESDLLGEFLEDVAQVMPGGREEQAKLYGSWRAWNERNGTRAGAKASFSRKLTERGHVEAKSNGKRYYAGLILKNAQA